MADREGMLEKIQKLLALSQNNPFSEEAQSAREKADALMQQYRVEQWELQFKGDPRQVEDPVLKWIHTVQDGTNYKLGRYLQTLGYICGRHAKCEVGYKGWDLALVGFPGDVAYAHMLYTHLFTHFVMKLQPTYDHNLSFEENLVRCKEAGMKWEETHRILQPDVPFERRHGVRYTGIYTKYCKEHGRHRTYSSPDAYFEGFANGFISEVQDRFWALRRRMDLEGGVELAGRDAQVKEAFYNFFPHLRPRPEPVGVPRPENKRGLIKYRAPRERKIAGDAVYAGREAARDADLIDRSGKAARHLDGGG
jgi:hypothetical protein